MLFPAYAGVILYPAISCKSDIPFPRIRRGDPYYGMTDKQEVDFSPHTQG